MRSGGERERRRREGVKEEGRRREAVMEEGRRRERHLSFKISVLNWFWVFTLA